MNNTSISYILGFCLFLLLVFLVPSDPILLQKPVYELKNQPEINNKQEEIVSPVFVDRTLSSGLFYVHSQGDQKLTGLDETLGSGACALDYNNDGWMDLFLVGGSGETRYYGKRYWWQEAKGNRLFRNNGDETFEDVTIEAGLENVVWGMGCASADLDNDGDSELIVTTKGQNFLYENSGDGSFTNISEKLGWGNHLWSTSISLADYDNDGLLDIYITNYLDYKKGEKTFEPHSGFNLNTSSSFNPALYSGLRNELWRNEGNLHFKDVTLQAGVANESGRSLSSQWLHLDEDQWPDLLVLNDSGFPNQLFKNKGDGTFSETGVNYSLSLNETSASASLGDISNKNSTDLSLSAYAGDLDKIFRRTGGKSLFVDKARMLKLDVDQHVNLGGWSHSLSDFNNDGWLDRLVVNGLYTPDSLTQKLPQGQKTVLYINQRGQRFHSLDAQSGSALNDSHSSRGLAIADYDNDGDLDFYMSNNNDLGQFIKNESTLNNRWLRLQLQGTQSNRDAIGARVWVATDETIREIQHFRHGAFLSQQESLVHIGLGKNATPVALRIQWPNGEMEEYNNLPTNKALLILEGEAIATELSPNAIKKEPPQLFNRERISSTEKKQLIDLMSELNDEGAFIAIIGEMLKDNDPNVRQHALANINLYQTIKTLDFLVASLDDHELSVQLTALEQLRQREIEHSSRWLVRQFTNSSPEFREALALTYAFFFQEEEAMIHRKNLAIPFLIQYLKDESEKVRIAAARALGESESFRAVDALLEMLRNIDNSMYVRAQAARALGKIRELNATDTLIALLEDEYTESLVKAEIIIALHRLGSYQLPMLFSLTLPNAIRPAQFIQVENGIEAFHEILYKNADGIVINPGNLALLLSNWFSNLTNDEKNMLSAKTLTQIVEVLKYDRQPKTLAILESILAKNNELLKATIYQQLIFIDSDKASGWIIKGLNENSPLISKAVFNAATRKRLSIPVGIIKKTISNRPSVEEILRYLSWNPHVELYDELLLLLQDNSLTKEEQKLLFDIFLTMPLNEKMEAIDSTLRSNEYYRQFRIKYWEKTNRSKFIRSKQTPELLHQGLLDSSPTVRQVTLNVLSNRKEIWAIRALRRVVTNKRGILKYRQSALRMFLEKHARNSNSLVSGLIADREDPLWVDAVRYVNFQAQKNQALLWGLLEDETLELEKRLVIASVLKANNQKKVLASVKRMIM